MFDKNKYASEFTKENYDRILLNVPKGKKQELNDYAKANDISVTELICKAIEEYTLIDMKKKSQKQNQCSNR